jgi:hypothetical protein
MKNRNRPLIPPTTKELVRFRNFLHTQAQMEADKLVYEALKHIPVWGEILDSPPPAPLVHVPMSLKDRNRLEQITRWLMWDLEVAEQCRVAGD